MPVVDTPLAWAKMTIASFRWEEVAAYYEWQGFDVKPLMIVRDPRRSFASLKNKPYGRNGTTAEDPPLRLRMLRFLKDWELFVDRGWPIFRYEDVVSQPEIALRKACADLGIVWDSAMIDWPKPYDQVGDYRRGNETFWASLPGANLNDALLNKDGKSISLAAEDAMWLDSTFSGFYKDNGYPGELSASELTVTGSAVAPSFDCTERYEIRVKLDLADKRLGQLSTLRGCVSSVLKCLQLGLCRILKRLRRLAASK